MIATSLDGQWAIVRRGRDVVLLERGVAPPVAQITLDNEDIELAMVGPPAMLCTIARTPEPTVTLYVPPHLEAVARLELEAPMHLAAITGSRMVLATPDKKLITIVRAAGRGLAAQRIDPGTPIEFIVGLERNQVLFGLLKKLEVWDAVSSRPLLRLQLQLPSAPRSIGAAQGHLWVTRPGSDEVLIYRLSDGRPFRHIVGAPVEDVICHAASPVLVLVTPQGLVRLHCLAHSLSVIDTPWTPGMPLAQLVAGEDISLLGIGAGESEPWRAPISGAGAPVGNISAEPTEHAVGAAADRLREMRERAARGGGEFAADATAAPRSATVKNRTWREPLGAFGTEVSRGNEAQAEVPIIAVDNELGDLTHRLGLSGSARRALITLYSLYLVGEPAISIARLAHVLGDWTEALGQGDLQAIAMLRRRDGRVSLRASVTDLLDGASPRAIRVVGSAAAAQHPGASRLPRDGRSDAAILTDLASRLGRIAVIEGAPALGLLEARLHGATAVALAPPFARPQPWPRDSGLVVVADGGAPAWVAALPAFS